MSEKRELDNLLDRALEGRSEGFKAKVLDLVVRYQWDINDPGFLLLISTGQMELLLNEFPEQFEGLVQHLVTTLDQPIAEFRRSMESYSTEARMTLQGMNTTNEALVRGFSSSVEELHTVVSQERLRAGDRVEKMLTIAREERQELDRFLERKVSEIAFEINRKVREEVNQIIEESGAAFRRKHQDELFIAIVLVVVGLLLLGITIGGFGFRILSLDPF
jgi:hypothetical protein